MLSLILRCPLSLAFEFLIYRPFFYFLFIIIFTLSSSFDQCCLILVTQLLQYPHISPLAPDSQLGCLWTSNSLNSFSIITCPRLCKRPNYLISTITFWYHLYLSCSLTFLYQTYITFSCSSLALLTQFYFISFIYLFFFFGQCYVQDCRFT